MERRTLLRSFLKSTNCDWVLISDSVEVQYITGLKSSNMYLLISEEESFLFTDFRYKEIAEKFCSEQNWTFSILQQNALQEILSHTSANSSVALQSDQLTIDQFEKMKENSNSNDFCFKGTEIAALFSPKTSSEINFIQQAASIADSALLEWKTSLRSGISERDAANLLEELCRSRGSEGTSFDTIVLFGERSALPHGVPSTSTHLQAGDTILVDFGCLINGYCSDMTRTFYFKSVSPSLQSRYEITLRAQRAGVEALTPGIKASEIDKIVRNIITEQGFGEQFGHGTGHGVGLRIHEQPALNRHDSTLLKPGMVITVEPGIYVPKDGGVRIEDLLLITEEGYLSLSKSPRELEILKEKQ